MNWHSLFDADRPGRRYSLESPAATGRGRAITVASQKGGVGKTTTVVNIAAAAGLCGRKVLLIDFDPQANATSGVSCEKTILGKVGDDTSPDGSEYRFLAALGSEAGVRSLIEETEFENLWVLPSFHELSDRELLRAFFDTYINQWKSTVTALKRTFDVVIIDCPPSLGGIPNLALLVSDEVIIPVQCEYYAMEGLSQILPVIEEVQRTKNERLTIGGLLLTMYSDDLELSGEVSNEIREYFGDLVFESTIPRDVTLAESASHGLPAVYYDFYCRGAWSYLNLTREVMADERSKAGTWTRDSAG